MKRRLPVRGRELNTSIVIPAYNEEFRLPRTLNVLRECIRANSLAPIVIKEVIVVDDGSTDKTINIALGIGASSLPEFRVIESTANFGKGHAIRVGILAAHAECVLVADADMSTPWTEVVKLAAQLHAQKAHVAIASRDLAQSDIRIKQSWMREHMGKTFNLIVRFFTGLPFHDTQCGFKFFTRAPVIEFARQLTVNRFAWDVEFLMFAINSGLKVVEVPVTWEHQEESRVHPIRDGLNMLFTVIGLRFRLAKVQSRTMARKN